MVVTAASRTEVRRTWINAHRMRRDETKFTQGSKNPERKGDNSLESETIHHRLLVRILLSHRGK